MAGGNVLIDGNPAGGAAVHVAYPHAAKSVGNLGPGRYEPGHNFGVRVTHVGDDKFRVEHLVDGIPDEKSLELKGSDLPDGGFGFEYCCGRSFVVDNVVVEHSAEGSAGEESFEARPTHCEPHKSNSPRTFKPAKPRVASGQARSPGSPIGRRIRPTRFSSRAAITPRRPRKCSPLRSEH